MGLLHLVALGNDRVINLNSFDHVEEILDDNNEPVEVILSPKNENGEELPFDGKDAADIVERLEILARLRVYPELHPLQMASQVCPVILELENHWLPLDDLALMTVTPLASQNAVRWITASRNQWDFVGNDAALLISEIETVLTETEAAFKSVADRITAEDQGGKL